MVYEFLADGFEEIEAITPVDLLRRAGIEIKTVGVTGFEVTGSHGIMVMADVDIHDIALTDDLDMIILPGGNPGYINLEGSQIVRDAIAYCEGSNKYIAAICAAPSILGRLGLLQGKNATVYPGMESELTGANVVYDPVVQDGNIITSRGAGTAIPFAAKLIEVLKNKEEAEKVLKAIVYQ